MKNKQIFQYVILAVFGFGALVAVLVFSGKINIGGKEEAQVSGSLVVWGPVNAQGIRDVFTKVQDTYKNLKVEYQAKDPRYFQEELVNALASGVGPDLFIFGPEFLLENAPRLFEIPFATYPELSYKSAFVEQASRNLTPTGVLAVPLVIDPLILYYNVDILSSAFIPEPPATWDDVMKTVPDLTERTNSGVLGKSAIAFGSYDNITNAKEIFATLLFQAGMPITSRDEKGIVRSVLTQTQTRENPAERALAFFVQFSDPTNALYTWNPSLANDKQKFLAGTLAYYIGYASEFPEIQKKNPNLNFNITLMPQRSQTTTKSTYGTMQSIGISKVTKNRPAALAFISWLAKKDQILAMSQVLSLAPARKDLLAQKQNDDAYKALLYNSAIISRGWMDPDGEKTDALFRDMIRGITSGSIQNSSQAIRMLHAGISTLIQ